MVYLREGEEITYTTGSGEDRKARISLIDALTLGCVGITHDGDDQKFITAGQIHGVELSDDAEAWEIDGAA